MEDSLQTHEYLAAYFQENFGVGINGAKSSFTYLGGEVEDDVIWCYIEVTNVDQLESIQLTNKVLTEVYDDQKNLVHFKIGGEKKSFILSQKEFKAEYQK